MRPARSCNETRRRWALALIAAAGAAIWLVALPLAGRRPAISRYIERNERLGINPAAKFYTELPCMPELFDRVERARRRPSP